MEIRKVIEKGVPMVVGLCSCAVVEGLLKQHVPCKEELIAKVARRIGIFGIGCVASSMVTDQVEKEIASILDILGPLVPALRNGDDDGVKDVIADDIPWTYLNTDQDGMTEIRSRANDLEQRQEELRSMAEDLRNRIKSASVEAEAEAISVDGSSEE